MVGALVLFGCSDDAAGSGAGSTGTEATDSGGTTASSNASSSEGEATTQSSASGSTSLDPDTSSGEESTGAPVVVETWSLEFPSRVRAIALHADALFVSLGAVEDVAGSLDAVERRAVVSGDLAETFGEGPQN